MWSICRTLLLLLFFNESRGQFNDIYLDVTQTSPGNGSTISPYNNFSLALELAQTNFGVPEKIYVKNKKTEIAIEIIVFSHIVLM